MVTEATQARPASQPADARTASEPTEDERTGRKRSARETVAYLGVGAGTAGLLTGLGGELLAAPFDLLQASPAMVRDCLLDGFRHLLDPMLFDQPQTAAIPGTEACGHTAYRARFGIDPVFVGCDPRGMEGFLRMRRAVAALRTALAGPDEVLCVQILPERTPPREEFGQTIAALASRAPAARLLMIALALPPEEAGAPSVTELQRAGPHALYRFVTAAADGSFNAADLAALIDVARAGLRDMTGSPDGDRSGSVAAKEMPAVTTAEPDSPALPQAARPPLSPAAEWLQAHTTFHSATLAARAQIAREDTALADILHAPNGFLQRLVHDARIQVRQSFEAGGDGPKAWRSTYCLVVIEDGAVRFCYPESGRGSSLAVRILRAPVQALLAERLIAAGVTQARFFVDVGDYVHGHAAGFSANEPAACLIPDSDFVGSAGHAWARDLVAREYVPWEQRRRAAVWRGSSTGLRRFNPPPAGELDDFSWLPRLQLVWQCHSSPLAAYYDVGLSSLVQMPEPHVSTRIADAGLLRNTLSRTDFMRHKATIVIDGNANAWSALFCALLTGSCVLLVDSEHGFRQWYYDRLVPWENILSVRADLADLDEKLSWVLDNDDAACAIGQAGKALAESITFDGALDEAAARLRDWLAVGADPFDPGPPRRPLLSLA